MVAAEQVPLFPTEKRCTGRCGRMLPLDAFSRNKKAQDGLNWWCRTCMHNYHQAHRTEHNAQQSQRKKALRAQRRAERAAQLPRVMTHKTCCACDVLKPLADFQRTRRTRDGYQSWCKSCRKSYDLARKDEKAAYDQRYNAANAERIRQTRRLWSVRNAGYLRQYRRQRAALISARLMRSYWANPEPFKVRANQRRMRLHRIPGHFTAADIRLIREVQRGLCAYCGVSLAANSAIEHMIPITRGGTNWPWNICMSCAPCNRRKFTKTAGEYLALLVRERRAQAAV